MKLLVVGVGSIGRRHAINASELANVGVVDVDPSKADEVANEAGGTSYGADLGRALEWGPDGVIVAVPHKYHIKVAMQAVQAGADVLIEKPIGHDLDEAKEFIEYAESLGQNIYVVCNMRFHPAIQALYNSLQLIGKPLFARAHYGNYLPDMRPNVDYRNLYVADAEEGGVLLDAIHELDYLSWMFGPIKQISADASHISSLEIDADDYAGMLLKHQSGVRSEVHLDYLRHAKRRGCEICGTDGLLHWISEGKSPEHCVVRSYTPESGWNTILDDPDVDGSSSLMKMMESFVHTLNKSNQSLQTGKEAITVLATTLAARNGDGDARQI